MKKTRFNLFPLVLMFAVICSAVLLLPYSCLASGDYKPGETARLFHDQMTGFPSVFRTKTTPDFSQFASENVYQQNAYWKWGPGCRIQAKAYKKYLYGVSAEIDRDFPDIISHYAMEWAFLCIVTTTAEANDPAFDIGESRKNFLELWRQINLKWMTSTPENPSVILEVVHEVGFIAIMNGDKLSLDLFYPQTQRIQKLIVIQELLKKYGGSMGE